MQTLKEHRGFWSKERKTSLYVAIFLLLLAVVIQVTAGRYSSKQALVASPAGDVFLDNLPYMNIDFIIVTGGILLWVLGILALSAKPRYLLFGLKAIAIFVITRAFFISLTHIGVYPTHMVPDENDPGYRIYELITFQGNYFFSGHTGFPFLMALIFSNRKFWRNLFFFMSLVMGFSVLLAHVHYSIDVFAAPFMTYGVYKITQKLFPADYSILENGDNSNNRV